MTITRTVSVTRSRPISGPQRTFGSAVSLFTVHSRASVKVYRTRYRDIRSESSVLYVESSSIPSRTSIYELMLLELVSVERSERRGRPESPDYRSVPERRESGECSLQSIHTP